MQTQLVAYNRDDLARFIKDPRTIRAFEALNTNQDDIVQAVGQIEQAPLIGISLSDVFTEDRALAGSSDIQLTDGGAKANLSISLATSGVSAGAYGDASHFVGIAVDNKGRLTLAAQYLATTANVAEVTNLYFTDARARSAVSGSSTVSYNSGTGIFSLTSGNVTTALGFSPQPVDAYLTAISGTVPAPDGTYLSPTSITIVNGIITAIS
jgi:hypothetical protein